MAKNTARISDAAERLFLTEGYSVSMETIAAEAKVSRHALYARFPDKRALLIHVVERLVAQWTEQTQLKRAELLLPLHERLEILATRTIRHLVSDKAGKLAKLVFTDGERFPELKSVAEIGMRNGVETFSAALMADDVDRSTHVHHDARLAASALIYMLMGWSQTQSSAGTPDDQSIRKAARYFSGILIGGRHAW